MNAHYDLMSGVYIEPMFSAAPLQCLPGQFELPPRCNTNIAMFKTQWQTLWCDTECCFGVFTAFQVDHLWSFLISKYLCRRGLSKDEGDPSECVEKPLSILGSTRDNPTMCFF